MLNGLRSARDAIRNIIEGFARREDLTTHAEK
jgi:hypothetical protein